MFVVRTKCKMLGIFSFVCTLHAGLDSSQKHACVDICISYGFDSAPEHPSIYISSGNPTLSLYVTYRFSQYTCCCFCSVTWREDTFRTHLHNQQIHTIQRPWCTHQHMSICEHALPHEDCTGQPHQMQHHCQHY